MNRFPLFVYDPVDVFVGLALGDHQRAGVAPGLREPTVGFDHDGDRLVAGNAAAFKLGRDLPCGALDEQMAQLALSFRFRQVIRLGRGVL
jgi:hypothetical protein